MKQYPSIEHWSEDLLGRKIFAFDKLDGSNLRFEWSRKRGWYKFGTRGQMIDERHEQFGKAIPTFLDKYGDALPRVFLDNQHYKNVRNFVVFCEYLGANSFAGRHAEGDIMDTILFDVNPITKGFVAPKEFIRDFGHLHTPGLIYSGVLTMDFINDVKNGKYPLTEGVLVKGADKKTQVWMIKIKTLQWLEKLKEVHGQKALEEEFGKKLITL